MSRAKRQRQMKADLKKLSTSPRLDKAEVETEAALADEKQPWSTTHAELITASSQPIERITRSGGGAKGVNYPGSFEAEVETGIHVSVMQEAGASAGAITSSLIACGIKPAAFRALFLKENFQDLMGTRVTDKTKVGNTFLTKNGIPLLTLIRDNINSSITAFLKEHPQEADENIEKIRKKLAVKDPITFADLAVLHKKWPADFKQLSVIAVKFPNGEPQIFDHESTPNVEIALACRASASLPVILEPVTIDLGGGGVHQFVDGGLYDNLPVDYFDRDEKGAFIKNTKPNQTLIYAFGEGIDDRKNQVFQAQFGGRMDEMIGEEILSGILEDTISKYSAIKKKKGGGNSEKIFKEALNQALTAFVATAGKGEAKQFRTIAKIIQDSANKNLVDLFRNPLKHAETYIALEKKGSDKAAILSKFLKQAITPVLYKAGPIEELKRNKLVGIVGMKPAYKNTQQKELGYQRIRDEYPLRTVELRVGNIKTTDFKAGTKYARIMNTLGYLDTTNFIINHELYDPMKFNPQDFYKEIVENFEKIHSALLEGSQRNQGDNKLIQEIGQLRVKLKGQNDEVINRAVFHLIKQNVEKDYNSPEAFALSRAHEFRSKHIDANQLFKEVYEQSFRRSSILSQSKVSGKTIYRSSTLHEQLKDKDMFKLQKENQSNKRYGKIFSALKKLDSFQNAKKQTESSDNLAHISPPSP